MRVLNIIYAVTLIGLSCIPVQGQKLKWVIDAGAKSPTILGMVSDKEGNIYTYGNFAGTTDLDPGPGERSFTAGGATDCYVQKFDSEGKLLWVYAFGSFGRDGASGRIAIDDKGHLYIIGAFSDRVDFDFGPKEYFLESYGNEDLFILKLDLDGKFIWAGSMGSPNKDGAGAVTVADNGDLIINGYFKTIADLDPGPGVRWFESKGNRNVFMERLDSSGQLKWIKIIGGTEDIYSGNDVGLDSLGNLYFSGIYEGKIDLNPGKGEQIVEAKAGKFDYYLLKLDGEGNYLWANGYGGSGTDINYDLDVGPDGRICVVGSFENTMDFESGQGVSERTSNGITDGFIQYLDTDGKLLWVYTYGGIDRDVLGTVLHDPFGNLYVTGAFQDSFDIVQANDTFRLESQGGWDMLFLKVDTNGKMEKLLTMGGKKTDFMGQLSLVPGTGDIIIEGIFQDSVDFDPDPVGEYYLDYSSLLKGFILKLSQCDLDLTIINKAPTLEARSRFTTYQWLDCGDDFKSIPGANQQYFEPGLSGSYAVEVSNGFCTDTSECIEVIVSAAQTVEKEMSIRVEPNPSGRIFNLHLGTIAKRIEVDIVDVLGRSVLSKVFTHTDRAELSFRGAPGVYFLTVQVDQSPVRTIKLLKE